MADKLDMDFCDFPTHAENLALTRLEFTIGLRDYHEVAAKRGEVGSTLDGGFVVHFHIVTLSRTKSIANFTENSRHAFPEMIHPRSRASDTWP